MMAVRNIVLAGNPALRSFADPVAQSWFNTDGSKTIIEDLFDTLKACQAVGLAAIQINIPLRIIVYGFTQNQRYPNQDSIADTILINPKIMSTSTEISFFYEGCLSLPELRGLVPRYHTITITAQNHKGEWLQKICSGFEARIIQHEIDHLDGTLFPERMENLQTLGVTSALKAANIIP